MDVTDSQALLDISTQYGKNHVQMKEKGQLTLLLVFGQSAIKRRSDRVQNEYYFNLYFYWMERVLSALQLKVSWKQAMRKSCRSNKLNVDLVSYFTPLRMRAAYQKFLKMYQKKGDDKVQRWLQNQLKAFYWICVAMSCVEELPIASFSQCQWKELNEIFFCKGKLTLEYEAKKLIQNITHRPFWEIQEDNLLTTIVQNNGPQSNKWNDFARKLYESSERKFIRTGKQCRERWLNHLDPTKKHGEWTSEEQKNIVTLLLCFGKKWSKIAKTLGNSRTQHMIKNRFKTICSRQRKVFPYLKTQEQLLKSFIEPASTKQEQEPPKTVTSSTQIKAEHNSSQNQQIISPEQSFEDMGLNDLIQQDNKGKNLHSGNSFDMPQVFSPWYVGIPITPTFSPSVPFLVNFSAGFSSFDSHCANQFYCPKKSNENSFDHQ